MKLQQLLSKLRKAADDYRMIDPGDKIAVGLSGGKDSLALLYGLAAFKRFSPAPFELAALTIDLGAGADYSPLVKLCEDLDVAYRIEKTQIAQIIFEERKEKNPCSLCSKMRRGALNSVINAMGYNKLALGHHADDLVETLLLSLFYEGRLSTFAPVSHMDRTGVTLIRPLVYAEEKDIAALAKAWPVVRNPCPANHVTQREYVKTLLKNISQTIPFVKERIHSAIVNPERNNLWDKTAPVPLDK